MAAKRLVPLAGGVTIICAVCAALAAWVTGGALTLTSFQPNASRIGILPSPLWLAMWTLIALVARKSTRANTHQFALLSLSIVLLAPWMPVTVPHAIYIWTGALRIWLWVIILAGLIAPAVVRRAPRALARVACDPRRAPWLAAGVAAVVYAAGAYQVSPQIPTGDEPHYLVITQSILRDHDLKIENNHRRGDYREYYAGELKPDYLRRGADGEIYSVHAPGLAVLVAPAFALFGYPGVLACLALLGAWATALAWKAAWHATTDVAASWFGWAAVALTAPFFFQSFVVYPDAPGGALVMVGVLALVDRRTPTPARLVTRGAALAMLPWLHTRYAIAAVMLGAMILARLLQANDVGRRVRQALALLAVPTVSAVCWFGFFYLIYGTPDPRGPYAGSTQSALANLPRGAVGLLFDQQFGLLPAAPVLLCALAGLVVMMRRSPRLGVELLMLVAPYCVVVGAYQMWWGGNSSAVRFLIPVLLPFAIPAALWFHSHRGHTARLLGLGALAVSLLMTVTIASVDRGVLLYNSRDGASRLLMWLSPLVDITTGLPSVFQTDASTALWHGTVWIAAIALATAVGLVVERRGATRTTVAVAIGFSAIAAATGALSVVWRDHSVAPMTPRTSATGTVAFLQRYDVDSGQFAVRYGPLRRARMRDILSDLTLADVVSGPQVNTEPAATLSHLPAGVYAIEETTTGATSGHSGPMTVTLDTGFGSQWSWSPPDSTSVWREEIRLPVSAPGLAIYTGDSRHRRLLVRPVSIVGSRHRVVDGEPLHVVRYGSAVVFLMRGWAYVEPTGTWVGGGGSADFVISPDDGAQVRLFVRNPPVENEVTLEGNGWREHLVLKPREERTVTVPVKAGTGAVWIRVTAAHGARPIQFEPGSTDTRFLGCWIEARS